MPQIMVTKCVITGEPYHSVIHPDYVPSVLYSLMGIRLDLDKDRERKGLIDEENGMGSRHREQLTRKLQDYKQKKKQWHEKKQGDEHRRLLKHCYSSLKRHFLLCCLRTT